MRLLPLLCHTAVASALCLNLSSKFCCCFLFSWGIEGGRKGERGRGADRSTTAARTPARPPWSMEIRNHQTTRKERRATIILHAREKEGDVSQKKNQRRLSFWLNAASGAAQHGVGGRRRRRRGFLKWTLKDGREDRAAMLCALSLAPAPGCFLLSSPPLPSPPLPLTTYAHCA